MWKAAIKSAGLPKEISIHCARHTVAVHLLRKTRNLRQVQKQLGHADPIITANMYADVTFEDMQKGISGLYDGDKISPETNPKGILAAETYNLCAYKESKKISLDTEEIF
jgi:hypothetical protein